MREIQLPQHEQGTTRLFALSMESRAAASVKADGGNQAALLGVDTLDEQGVEVFRVADLDDLGLIGYLRDGVDAQEDDLARDRIKLAALDGWVMLVHSSAFRGEAVVLKPAPELTLIGTYLQKGADTAPIVLSSNAAEPYSGNPDITPIETHNNRNAGSLVVVGLLIIAATLLWWALA